MSSIELSSVSLRLPTDLVQRISELAKKTGRTRTYYMQQAIQQHIEDMEDFYEAEQAMLDIKLGKSRLYNLDEAEAELGLDN